LGAANFNTYGPNKWLGCAQLLSHNTKYIPKGGEEMEQMTPYIQPYIANFLKIILTLDM
jgi:hypothetical protein